MGRQVVELRGRPGWAAEGFGRKAEVASMLESGSSSSNTILHGLSAEDTQALHANAREIPLEQGALIADAGQTAPFVYFPIEGVLSLVGTTSGGATVEVAVVGNEGFASVSSILGSSLLPFRIVTQVPGRALRVPTAVIAGLVNDCSTFHERVLDYTQALISQIGQSAVCNRFHNARQRLARWLLMTADRTANRDLPLTHEFISFMVGGPRSAVTEAAAELREAGAIACRRGHISIARLDLLRQQSCECYAVLAGAERAA